MTGLATSDLARANASIALVCRSCWRARRSRVQVPRNGTGPACGDDYFFLTRSGELFVSKKPAKPGVRPVTPVWLQATSPFKVAGQYASDCGTMRCNYITLRIFSFIVNDLQRGTMTPGCQP